VFSVWEAGSAKFGWLPQPFFPPPHAILEVFADDWRKLIQSIVASVKLEFLGFALGAACGFAIGVLLGRSRLFGYWVHPVLKLIGPLPAIACSPSRSSSSRRAGARRSSSSRSPRAFRSPC
jgi:NitT/TauT family transport system permease protein